MRSASAASSGFVRTAYVHARLYSPVGVVGDGGSAPSGSRARAAR
ncbi:Uncharacterised protein [Mycobacteroides abscessus]|nr:Uncharacterised protein [Mycobacteroides abscessus]